jgi:hypothetical protein
MEAEVSRENRNIAINMILKGKDMAASQTRAFISQQEDIKSRVKEHNTKNRMMMTPLKILCMNSGKKLIRTMQSASIKSERVQKIRKNMDHIENIIITTRKNDLVSFISKDRNRDQLGIKRITTTTLIHKLLIKP